MTNEEEEIIRLFFERHPITKYEIMTNWPKVQGLSMEHYNQYRNDFKHLTFHEKRFLKFCLENNVDGETLKKQAQQNHMERVARGPSVTWDVWWWPRRVAWLDYVRENISKKVARNVMLLQCCCSEDEEKDEKENAKKDAEMLFFPSAPKCTDDEIIKMASAAKHVGAQRVFVTHVMKTTRREVVLS